MVRYVRDKEVVEEGADVVEYGLGIEEQLGEERQVLAEQLLGGAVDFVYCERTVRVDRCSGWRSGAEGALFLVLFQLAILELVVASQSVEDVRYAQGS